MRFVVQFALPFFGSVDTPWWMAPTLWIAEAGTWIFMPLFTHTDHVMALSWNLAFAASLVWIAYRIFEIYRKPVTELVDILGIDIPPVPDVALAGITTDSVLLYWKPPENYHSALRHFIQVNGINVGEFNRSDASVQVTGLKPGCYYSIRAIATNAGNFSSLGRLIRIRTIPSTGHEGSKALISDHGMSQGQNRRTASGKRTSSAANAVDSAPESLPNHGNIIEDGGSEETMAQLTKKLDLLREQQEELDGQIAEDAEDAERTKAALTKERDELKLSVEEKERAYLEFKKQVNELEKQSKAAQRKKSAKERQLQQKRAEKQKITDDILKWTHERVEISLDIDSMREEKEQLDDEHKLKMAATRKTIEECQNENKAFEEDVRLLGIKIKELEEERRKSNSGESEEEREAERREREEEHAHEKKMQEFQASYTGLWKMNQQLEIQCQQFQERLNFLLTKRAKDPGEFAPIPGLDFPTSAAAMPQRRMRQGASRASTMSQSSAIYPISMSSYNNLSGISPTFSSASPFFNMSNGMAVATTAEKLGLSQREISSLTAGAPMSPTANTLLPSNLLGDDDFTNRNYRSTLEEGIDSGIFPRGSTSYRPSSAEVQDPHSPLSINSRSPSLLSSPHESLHNQHGYYLGRDHLIDGDRQSINSTKSPSHPSIVAEANSMGGRGFSQLFNFNRQRGKSSMNEPPALGTLKQGQSQSFPRNLDQGSIELIGSSRRRLGSGTWTNPMTSFLTRANTGSAGTAERDIVVNPRLGSLRRSRLFGSKLDPTGPLTSLDRSSSPRPSSTYSFENALPRPSSDSQPFGWMSSDMAAQHSSPLGVDWSSLGGPWSRNQSRRASVQHGSTSNLSIGSTPLDPDDFSSPYGKKSLAPAPIGTERFQKAPKYLTPKLNPTAPSFTTRLFRRESKNIKAEKSAEKPGEKVKVRDQEKNSEFEADQVSEQSSPYKPRPSQDTHSITTATSAPESHDSLELSNSAPSESAGAPTTKEKLKQILTGKGSTSKFNPPWSKDRSSIFSKKSGEPSTPGEVDEDSDYQLGKSVDSALGTPQQEKAGRASLSWSRVMKRSKKGEQAASESSEKASETEMGDEYD